MSFDRHFIDLMTRHHMGAVAMADLQLRQGSDLRLRMMAHAIRHGQQGEIAFDARRERRERSLDWCFRNMISSVNPPYPRPK
jgi:hypothetical protein